MAILGGGIAGLWALDRLRAAGYAALLLQKGALGAGQTMASQGIIHSGLKYHLPGGDDLALDALADMPRRWRASLGGEHGPDLRAARLMSPSFLGWVPPRLGAGVLARMAQSPFRSATADVPAGDWPAVFRSARSGGALFRVDEPVVDVPSVMATLARQHAAVIRALPDGPVAWRDGVLSAGALALRPRCVLLAAGAGNESLPAVLSVEPVPCQRRPLRQVMVAGMAQPVYAHCIGAGIKPLATVTSHPAADGSWIWYVGGGIAEDGAGRPGDAVLQAAQRQLPELFPGADFAAARWASLAIDRAEYGGDGQRPGDVALVARGQVLVVWPTKLALVPRLGDLVVERVGRLLGEPGRAVLDDLSVLPAPPLAQPPWQTVEQWI